MSTHATDKIHEIIDNPQFAEWVKSDFNKANGYWDQWKAQNSTDLGALDEAILMYLKLQEPAKNIDSKIWDRIHQSIQSDIHQPRATQLRLLPIISAIAAAFILILGVYSLFYSDHLIVATDGFVSHVLPDGSSVTLNKDSKISYSKHNFLAQRNLTLEGEAFFEVKKGSTFSVHSTSGMVEVLGTSFNIYDRSGHLEVTCKTGKVAVTSQNSSKRSVLAPGDKIKVIGDHQEVMRQKENEHFWTSGSFNFENQDLELVLTELARQYRLKLDLKADIHQRKYNGFFKSDDLKNAVASVCWPMGLDCRVVGNKLVVTER